MRFGRTHPVALTLIVIAAVLMMMPLFWVLALSFKANAALMADTNSVFSLPYTLANYRTLFGDGHVFRWIIHRLLVSLGMTAGVLVLSSLDGYGFARLQFPGRTVGFVFVNRNRAVCGKDVLVSVVLG